MNRSSKKLLFIAIGALVLSTIVVVSFYGSRKPKTVNQLPNPYPMTPSDITTAAGVAQSFTVTYPVSGGWQNLSDASLYIAGAMHDQWVHYKPATKSFTLQGADGSCTAGQAVMLSTGYLILNCGASSASASGEKPMVTFSLTPLPSFSGVKYIMSTIVIDKANKGSGGIGGNWTIE